MTTYTDIRDGLERLAQSLQFAIATAETVEAMCGSSTPAGWSARYSMGQRTRRVQAQCEQALAQLGPLADWAEAKARKEARREVQTA